MFAPHRTGCKTTNIPRHFSSDHLPQIPHPFKTIKGKIGKHKKHTRLTNNSVTTKVKTKMSIKFNEKRKFLLIILKVDRKRPFPQTSGLHAKILQYPKFGTIHSCYKCSKQLRRPETVEVGCPRHPGGTTIGNQLQDGDHTDGWLNSYILNTPPPPVPLSTTKSHFLWN